MQNTSFTADFILAVRSFSFGYFSIEKVRIEFQFFLDNDLSYNPLLPVNMNTKVSNEEL